MSPIYIIFLYIRTCVCRARRWRRRRLFSDACGGTPRPRWDRRSRRRVWSCPWVDPDGRGSRPGSFGPGRQFSGSDRSCTSRSSWPPRPNSWAWCCSRALTTRPLRLVPLFYSPCPLASPPDGLFIEQQQQWRANRHHQHNSFNNEQKCLPATRPIVWVRFSSESCMDDIVISGLVSVIPYTTFGLACKPHLQYWMMQQQQKDQYAAASYLPLCFWCWVFSHSHWRSQLGK